MRSQGEAELSQGPTFALCHTFQLRVLTCRVSCGSRNPPARSMERLSSMQSLGRVERQGATFQLCFGARQSRASRNHTGITIYTVLALILYCLVTSFTLLYNHIYNFLYTAITLVLHALPLGIHQQPSVADTLPPRYRRTGQMQQAGLEPGGGFSPYCARCCRLHRVPLLCVAPPA